MNIGWFFYIGGNDSMDTVSKLSRYAAMIGSDIRIIGEPKTIDNDLVHTDHTPGFGSAARYVASTVREITLDANVYEKKSVTIVEIMGRHAGCSQRPALSPANISAITRFLFIFRKQPLIQKNF